MGTVDAFITATEAASQGAHARTDVHRTMTVVCSKGTKTSGAQRGRSCSKGTQEATATMAVADRNTMSDNSPSMRPGPLENDTDGESTNAEQLKSATTPMPSAWAQITLPTGAHWGPPPTPWKHKNTAGWTLHTEVRPSQIPGAGDGLFVREKAKKDDRIARYYGELIGPEEAARRRANGAQYLVEANSKQWIDAAEFKQQQGCYANDGGKANNARISTKVNRCGVTGVHWVSVLARKSIKAEGEVFVPYGSDFKRPWRTKTTPVRPAMAMRATASGTTARAPQPTADDARNPFMDMVVRLTRLPRAAQRTLAGLWNSAVHWTTRGQRRRRDRTSHG